MIYFQPMRKGNLFFALGLCVLLFFCTGAHAQPLNVLFMEPDTTRAKAELPAFQLIYDVQRLKTYNGWLNNGAARWAFDLYEQAWKISNPSVASYYIALVPGGNHAKVGFQLSDGSLVKALPHMTYIELEPEEQVFITTLLHETGHMILTMLNGGKEIPKKEIVSIPHTTAALTDRGTAYDEGFAIHLETLAAHYLDDPFIQDRYNHARVAFGVPSMLGEYHRIAGDLLSYSQTRTRYIDIRENHFAFAPSFRGPDYFRVQLEKSRDFSELRTANQLLQSEGFYASFFFSYLVRGNATSQKIVVERQQKMLKMLAALHASGKVDAETPFLLKFVETVITKAPEEGKEALDVLLDLSHGVFIDKSAQKLWRDHYLASLQMDFREAENVTIANARTRWKREAYNDPQKLYSQIGPQLPVRVPERTILLVAFEESVPLSFDLNTADEGIIRMIPHISDREIESWLTQRTERPFADPEDFRETLSAIRKSTTSDSILECGQLTQTPDLL